MIFIKTGDVATIHGDAASPQPFAYQFSCKASESVRWLADRGALTAKTERCKDWERRSQFWSWLDFAISLYFYANVKYSLLRFFMNHPFLMTQWVSSSRLSTCKRTEPDDRCLAEMAPVKLLVFREDLPAEKIHSEPKLQMLVTVGVSLLSCSKFEACDHVIGFWVRRNIQTNCYSTISPTGGVLEIKWLYIHPPINNQTTTTITRP